MKLCIVILLFLMPSLCSQAQWVFHPDLYKEYTRNYSTKFLMDGRYAHTLGKIENYRNKVKVYSTGIATIQQTIYKNLTNINDAIKDGKMAYNVSKLIPKILDNALKATELAAGKPYLVPVASQFSKVVIGRIANIQTYMTEIINSNKKDMLIDQAQRDKMLREVLDNIQIIYNYSEAILRMFRTYNLQQAIIEINPFQDFIIKDKMIIQNIQSSWKF